jgi:acid stress-induced BolA-like protein IbaG/YrbA
MDPKQVERLIRQALPDARIEVQSEDNIHFSARLVSAAFQGLRPLARHQLVYRALGASVGQEIHALSIEAYTPQEWSARTEPVGREQAGPGGG